jgi:chromosome segregation ATPase
MTTHHRLFAVLLTLAAALPMAAVNAQTDPTAATADTGTGELDYDRLLTDVEEAASLVNSELDELSTALQASINSQAEVDERFAQLSQMLDQVGSKLGESSDNWRLVQQAIDQAESERQAMLEKYTKSGDPDYQGFADAWAKTKQRLADVREGLLQERTNMEQLRIELETSRDKITQLIKLKRADDAAAKLATVRDHLAAMNETMRTLVENTKSVAQGLPN